MKKLLMLTQKGSELFFEGYELLPGKTDPEALTQAEVIIGEPSLEELRQAKNLRWLQMTWAGADRYLAGGFPENVILTTASGAFGETISEHALALLLSLCRRLPAYGRTSAWEDLGCEKQLAGGTALIFGCGDIGSQIAQKLKVLGVRTVGVCRNMKAARKGFDILTNLECAPAFFEETDFILCALPHSEETAGYFNKEKLSLLKDDAIIINVGRGSFLDAEALTELLQEGKFFGAGLDVLEQEPLPASHPLWSLSNVIITPHVAGVSLGHLPATEEKIWAICRENLSRYLKGEPLRNRVVLP